MQRHTRTLDRALLLALTGLVGRAQDSTSPAETLTADEAVRYALESKVIASRQPTAMALGQILQPLSQQYRFSVGVTRSPSNDTSSCARGVGTKHLLQTLEQKHKRSVGRAA